MFNRKIKKGEKSQWGKRKQKGVLCANNIEACRKIYGRHKFEHGCELSQRNQSAWLHYVDALGWHNDPLGCFFFCLPCFGTPHSTNVFRLLFFFCFIYWGKGCVDIHTKEVAESRRGKTGIRALLERWGWNRHQSSLWSETSQGWQNIWHLKVTLIRKAEKAFDK